MSAALEPFAAPDQKARADHLGLMVFLASEVMLFGGLFACIGYYRAAYPDAAAEASQKLDLWIATANTAVLLTSSLFAALADVAAKAGRTRAAAAWLGATAAFGLAFLALKGVEYREDLAHDLLRDVVNHKAGLFIGLYYVATSLHAVHLTIGMGLVGWAAQAAARGRLSLPGRQATVTLIALYWHLVDIVWVFLFPLLYLSRPS